VLLEVIVQSVDDARAAADGGADRLEVVRALDDGGLTPAIALVEAIATAVSLPLRVMLRENAGFALLPGEQRRLQDAARALQRVGANGIGIVIGFADANGVRMQDVAGVLAAAPDVHATFHRAFDWLTDPDGAIPAIASCAQIDRILTSGGTGTAAERAARLARYAAAAGSRLTILAGGGVDLESAEIFARQKAVREIHIGRAARANDDASGPVAAARVRAIRELIDRWD
jgi:copper homeostasis protein